MVKAKGNSNASRLETKPLETTTKKSVGRSGEMRAISGSKIGDETDGAFCSFKGVKVGMLLICSSDKIQIHVDFSEGHLSRVSIVFYSSFPGVVSKIDQSFCFLIRKCSKTGIHSSNEVRFYICSSHKR